MAAGTRAGTTSVRRGITYHNIRIEGHSYNVEYLKQLWFTGEMQKTRMWRGTKPYGLYAVYGAVPFRGVSYNKRSGKYRAQCYRNGVRKFLGSFNTPEEASAAYEACVKSLEEAA